MQRGKIRKTGEISRGSYLRSSDPEPALAWSRDWLKFKNPSHPAARREFEEDWGQGSRRPRGLEGEHPTQIEGGGGRMATA